MYERVNELLGTGFKSDFSINWYWISIDLILPESFIREFKDYVVWNNVSIFQILSESFIREFKDKVDWSWISQYQVLSESFIREFQNYVNWTWISENQILSWDFILEFEDKVDWGIISLCQPFINPNYEKINKKILRKNKLYQLYQETKDRGWFLGYMNKRDERIFKIKFNYNNFKSRIYWKDLIKTNKVKYFEPLRTVKRV